MRLEVQSFTVRKRFPLTISRGTTAVTTNIWVRLQEDGIEGIGEASPFSIVREEGKNTESLLKQLQEITPTLEKFHPLDRQQIEEVLIKAKVSSSVRAAIDMDQLNQDRNLYLKSKQLEFLIFYILLLLSFHVFDQ